MPNKLSIPIEEQHFADLLNALPKEMSTERINKAFKLANLAHDGQFRMSGEPYICHPLATATILAKLGMDEESIIAGILHDVPEDTNVKVAQIKKEFGKNVANLVEALTKLSKVYYRHSMDERQIQSLKKMFLETANDIRVVVVKLADRLHNMQTIQYLRPEKQQRIARETLKIYAPLANLFGIYQLRRELEDMCFKILQPEEFAKIQSYLHDHEEKRKHFIAENIKLLEKAFKDSGMNVEITGRPKHLYSIYQKSLRDKKTLSDIYDYFAVRILTQSREDCYKSLNIIHQCFKPKPSRFKDYIAVPKVNGYQTLHTTVVGLKGQPLEIQIRTHEMHYEAEFGAASHLLYKNELGNFVSSNIDILKKYKNPANFLKSLEEDILQNRIYVFSATGHVVNLPEGSSVLDYLYNLSFPVDKQVCKVLVNGHSYSLIGQLESGDHVDVVVCEEKTDGPERWWLGHVKTTIAKKKLGDFFSKQSFEQKVASGRDLLQQELDHEQKGLLHQLPKSLIRKTCAKFKEPDFASLLVKIGEGIHSAKDVYHVMFPSLEMPWTSDFVKNLKKSFSKLELAQKFNIGTDDHKYRIRIRIDAYDRVGLLREVSEPCYELGIPILNFHGRGYDTSTNPLKKMPSGEKIQIDESMISKINLELYVENHEELITLFDRLEKIPGIIRVQRVFRRKQFAFFSMLTITSLYVILHPLLLIKINSYNFKSDVLFFGTIYIAIISVFLLLILLRSMGNKTFPHFEETKLFWPLSFGLTLMLLATQFVNDLVFDLKLHTPVLTALSLAGLIFLTVSLKAHQRRKAELLKKLDLSRKKS